MNEKSTEGRKMNDRGHNYISVHQLGTQNKV